jgi:cytochrome c553
VEQQLLRFQHKERQNDSGVMGFVTEGLTPLEMRAVAAYIGQLQPVASTTPVKKK